ncbi:NAD-dependent epimerase/dehydratase family protein [Paenarthrobacter ureafaciens]|uniref:NAD-dependent epimerase/dehydratase family protein n=1 Tax=Paenarthrobacter ureafaciens TaxID=37931 RepID=UPI00241F0AF6|nr:NAD(P)-dependent oxidoreductase [Paenarthrobacter ureafaciens]
MSSRSVDQGAPEATRSAGRIRVLLIGASGFVGSRILRALQTRTDALVTILSRRPNDAPRAHGTAVVPGDLMTPSSLSSAINGIDVVINAASYVGGDREQAMRVNLDGTLAILRACESSPVSRIIQLSTTAVYGSGPHKGVHPWEVASNPESVASRSRAMAEHAVLAAGGIIVRPNLIYGWGDRWFIPGTVRMIKALGATIDHGRALISIIDVEDLGILAAALATTPRQVSGAFHAAQPIPISLRRLLANISDHIADLETKQSTSLEDAVSKLEVSGFRPHQVHMLGADHHYLSSELWTLAGHAPETFRISPEAISWYRKTPGLY